MKKRVKKSKKTKTQQVGKKTRTCARCSENKTLDASNFYRWKAAKHGFSYTCKSCVKAYQQSKKKKKK